MSKKKKESYRNRVDELDQLLLASHPAERHQSQFHASPEAPASTGRRESEPQIAELAGAIRTMVAETAARPDPPPSFRGTKKKMTLAGSHKCGSTCSLDSGATTNLLTNSSATAIGW